MPEAPLPNDPSTRTETGEIKDQSSVTTTQEPSTTTTTPTETTTSETKPEVKTETAGAPEKYEPFTLPEGVTLEGETLTKAQELFKAQGLTQAAAQSMVDFHVAQIKAIADAPDKAFKEMTDGWKAQTAADPELGPHQAKIKENLGKMFDTVGDVALTTAFKEAMNLTGVGDHPAFIKVLNKLALKVIEPGHVIGGGPTKPSQTPPGTGPVSVASAMYPNLPA